MNDFQSIIGLTIQGAGIYLVTILSFFMTRSIRRAFLDYWAVAWAALSVALTSLIVAFWTGALQWLLFPLYFAGEYVFVYLFFAGCRSYVKGTRLSLSDLRLAAAGIVVAIALSRVAPDFNAMFIFHAAIIAGLFIASFAALSPARRRGQSSNGLRVMSVALLLLALDFLHYVPVFAYVTLHPNVGVPYLRYTSVYDLILEILLGFGTVMLVMDDVRQEVEAANRELVAAHDRLEILARIDPLTEALNRHAFYSLIDNRGQTPAESGSGCAVVVDIDNLKPINDSFGHTAGDAAIREVARAIRSVIRADDLLFRWGGDEFLILLFNIPEEEAHKRINELNGVLDRTLLPGSAEPLAVIVSYGLAPFTTMAQIEKAIEQADTAMYARKQARKTQDRLQVR